MKAFQFIVGVCYPCAQKSGPPKAETVHLEVIRAEMVKGSFCLTGWCAVVFLFCGWALPQSLPSNLLDDTQFWSSLQLSAALSQRADLILIGSLRVGDDVSRLVYERGSAGVTLKVGKHVTLTPMYGYVATQTIPGAHTGEHRVSLDSTMTFGLGRFVLSDRNMLERRFLPIVHSSRYRNAVQISRPVRLGGITLWPFVSDEITYDWRVDALARNRFSVGGRKDLSEKASLDLFYLRQNGAYAQPRDLHVIGTTLRIRF
jgi:hypothetical protein